MEKQQISKDKNYYIELANMYRPSSQKLRIMKFKNHYNAEPSKGQENFEPSQTIPDQTMSIRELIYRHAQGLPIDGARVPIYEGEDSDLPDFKTMDLAEVEAYRIQAERELNDIKSALAEKETKDKEEKAKAAREAKNRQRNEITDIETESEETQEPAPQNQKPKKEPKAGS